MNNISITLFNGEGSGKIPKSSFPDGSFIFANKDFESLKEAYNHIAQNHSLSKPLELDNPIKTLRKVNNLKEYIPVKVNSLSFEIEDITNATYFKEVVLYFKNKKYACAIGKTAQWDGIYNFNIRVLLKTNLSNKDKTISSILEKMQEDLKGKCKIHVLAKSIVTSYPPTKNPTIYVKEKGKILSDSDIHITEIKDILDSQLTSEEKLVQDILDKKKNFNQELVDKCIEIFFSLGYSIKPNIKKSNAVSFSLTKDGKTDNGYFWYSSSPFIMNHDDKSLKNSIFHLLKNTKEGKEWLKEKTKVEQENELLKPHDTTSYTDYVITDERYLDFTAPDKVKLIDKFMDDSRSVFKIKSAMGTAKSSGIALIIEKAHARNEKVIIISNRVSVALDFADKYGITLYKDLSSIKSKNSVIVQYDSLHKYDPKDYDIVIFDEFISLLLHHRANLTTNANINAVKFKILLESKRVVIADAFLTGYEDKFFEYRNMYVIFNDYRDEVDLFEYKNKDKFLSTIIDRSLALQDGEHISCSFTSLNVMRVIEKELRDRNVKVIALSSETSEITRDIIYKKFKEDTHSAFQVILFTPTLTVGVSNLNNIIAHFHYDTGMAADVISSLQMTKRSRTSGEVHYYVEERQKHGDTNIDSINSITEENINNFYKNKDKTLLIDIDYETGMLKLTPLAIYINKIEVLNNILENNHGHAFKVLLNYQFISKPEIVDEVTKNLDLTNKVKSIKAATRKMNVDMLEQFSDTSWDYFEIEEIKKKISEKTNEEKVKLILNDLQEKFTKKLPKTLLVALAKIEIETDFTFIESVKNNKLLLQSNLDAYAKYNLSTAMSSDVASLSNKADLQFLEYLLLLRDSFILENSYDKEEIKNMDANIAKGRKFEKFLKKLGYIFDDKKYRSDVRVFKFIDYL